MAKAFRKLTFAIQKSVKFANLIIKFIATIMIIVSHKKVNEGKWKFITPTAGAAVDFTKLRYVDVEAEIYANMKIGR